MSEPPVPRGAAASERRRGPFGGSRDSSATQGFTLMEFLIVLLLLALIAALAVPNLDRLYASIQRQTERDYILDQFAGLGRMALLRGRGLVVAGTGPTAPESLEASVLRARETDAELHAIDLPDGWTIDLSRPLAIGANGVCHGAELTLLYDGKVRIRLVLEPPYCGIATRV